MLFSIHIICFLIGVLSIFCGIAEPNMYMGIIGIVTCILSFLNATKA